MYSNRDKDKEKSSSHRDKDKESRDKDKDRHKSSSSSKHKSSSSSSKHRDKDRHSKSDDRDRHRDKDRKNRIKDEQKDIKVEVKQEDFSESYTNDVDMKEEHNNLSQASSCDYSLSQFRPDESQFSIKAEAEDYDEQNNCGNDDGDPLAEEEDDEDDVPIVINFSFIFHAYLYRIFFLLSGKTQAEDDERGRGGR